MSITYSLSKNNLTNGANYYRAVVQSLATANLEQVIERMIARGCVVNHSDAESVIHHFFDAIEDYLLDGYRVVTRDVNFCVSIKGNFDGKTDVFSPDRHTIEAVAMPGAQLRRKVRTQARTQKVLAGQTRPELLEFTDWNSGQRDSLLTPGGLGQIIGQNLKFDPAYAEQGIFFVPAEGSPSQAAVVSHNTGGQLTFLIPASLAPGDYTLEVRASLTQGTPRSGTLEATLTVS
jgi:hypothetical protein